jgi:hypothetical protein
MRKVANGGNDNWPWVLKEPFVKWDVEDYFN